jgi:branched-chain amino acid transport system permease protein
VQFVQIVIGGVSQGFVYGLIALGFVLIYKATEAVNFAQGELMMLGAFCGLALATWGGLPYWAVLLGSAAILAVIGFIVEFALLRPVFGQPSFSAIMVTIGLGFLARGLVTMIPGFGTDSHALDTPFSGRVIEAGGLMIGMEHVVIIGAGLLLSAALYGLFRFTRIGIAMQAVSQNQLASWYVGIPVRRLTGLVWALSAAVAAVAGVLLAPIAFIHANMGFIGLKALPAAVIGGFDSLPGAIAGGLILGVIEALAGFYLPEGFKDVAAYVVVLVVLAVRPQGLFGQTSRKRV